MWDLILSYVVIRGGGVDNVQENDNSVGYVNSSGDGCDFGHDNGGGEKEWWLL